MKKTLLALFLGALLLGAPSFSETTIHRISGPTRHQTGIEVAKHFQSGTFILVNEQSYADALSASALTKGEVPILMTRSNELTPVTKDYLREQAEHVYLIGGEHVLSESIEEELQEMGIYTTRISGSSRYETSLEVAKESGFKDLFLTRGDHFADALSAGAKSLKEERAILLSQRDERGLSFTEFVTGRDITMVGGTSALSDELYGYLSAKAQDVRRVSGDTRYHTASLLAEDGKDTLIIASGENFPDALFATPLAQKIEAPILLTPRDSLDASTKEYLLKNKESIKDIYLIGGTGVLTERLERELFYTLNPTPYQPNDKTLPTVGGFIDPRIITPTIIENITRESLVNKFNALPKSYFPQLEPITTNTYEDLYLEQEAAEAWNRLTAKALNENIKLIVFSAYRNEETQRRLFEGYLRQNSSSAIRSSAYPRRSEHELGLAVDVSNIQGFPTNFDKTLQGLFMRNNARYFGFTLRYPEGKESITGYIHEPWHYRYVGVELAKELHEKNITLEEYYGLD